jgi:PIN domain nuclease of toxin-antitoxin system
LPDVSGTLLSNASTAGFPAGSVLQVVSLNNAISSSTTSSSFVSAGVDATITPSSTSSQIVVCAGIAQVNTGASGQAMQVSLYRDGASVSLIGTLRGDSSRVIASLQAVVVDSPNTTSEVAYQIYFRRDVGSSDDVYLQERVYFVLMEIAA